MSMGKWRTQMSDKTKSWNNFGGRSWSYDTAGNRLKTCPQCRTEIDSRARVCPNCHSKQGLSGKAKLVLVVVAFFALPGVLGSGGKSGSSTSTSTYVAAPTVGEQMTDDYVKYVKTDLNGESNCKSAVADMAKYDLRWTNSWGSSPFGYYNRYALPDGYVRLVGDEAEAQNGFGGWVRVNYTCLYDPATQTVKNVAMNNGRLPSTHGK
jgi:hypothetical protein